jgi:hypothetical protein
VGSRDAERIGLKAERDKLAATIPRLLLNASTTIEGIWSGTIARARRLPKPVLHVILNEEWQHHRYAVRDLAVLEKPPS